MAATAHSVVIPQHAGIAARLVRVLVAGIDHWHLLSLDAPTIAMLWTWFIAKANRVELPPQAVLAMGFAVWVLYVSDRLLDSRDLASSSIGMGDRELEARHYFHRSHQRRFGIGILAALAALVLLLPRLAPQALHLYLVLGGLLFGYFVFIHVNASPAAQTKAKRLPKELAVGVFFSAAAFIPTVARAPALRVSLVPAAALFAGLCSLNCLFIYEWEHPSPSSQPHAATRIALRWLPHLTLLAILTSLTFTIIDRSIPWVVPAACALAVSLLLLLHKSRHQLSPTTLRAAADLCLLTPVLLFPFLRR